MFCLLRLFFSLFPLILTTFIVSIIGFIYNTILLILIKGAEFVFMYVLILIQIGFIISIIISSKLLSNLLKRKNNCINNLTCLSITLSIFCFIDNFISFALVGIIFEEYNEDYEKKSFPKQYIALFIINLCFCFILLNLWISLIKINKEKKCCFESCCKKKPIKPNEKTNIEFHLTSGAKITIRIPSFKTVEKLIKFFLKKMKINKSDKNTICFIKDANKLNVNSNIFVKNEFTNSNHVLVVDQNNIIHPNENLYIYK